MFLRFIQNNKISYTLFVLLIVLLPTQLGKHFWPSFSFINGLRVDYLSPTIYVTDLCIILFILSVKKKYTFHPLFFFFLVLLGVNIYFSPQPLVGWYGFLKVIEYFFLWISWQSYFSPQKDFFSLLAFPISLSVFFESILAIWQYMLQHSIGGIFYFFGERAFSASTPGIANASIGGELILRPYGTLPHPNVLAALLLFGVTILCNQIFSEKKVIKKILYATSFLCGTIALFLSLSRIVILLWFMTVIFFLIKNIVDKKKIKYISVAIVCFIFLAGILLLFSHAAIRLGNFSLSDESISQRIFLISKAWDMFFSHFLFGVGFANFLLFLSQIRIPITSSVYLLQPVHNIFFLLLAEIGVSGFFFIALFLYKTIKHLLLILNKKEQAVLCFLLFMQFFILGQVDHYFITLQQGQILTTLILSLCWSV